MRKEQWRVGVGGGADEFTSEEEGRPKVWLKLTMN